MRRQRGFLLNPFRFSSELVCDAADFDGTNDFMLRGAGLTGQANSKQGIFSGWVRIDGDDGGTMQMMSSVLLNLQFARDNSNTFAILAVNTSAVQILDLRTVNTYLTSATWLHVLSSWDMAAAARHIYITDVSDMDVNVFTNDTIAYEETDWAVGARTTGTSKFNGCMAEIFFAPGQYLDFSSDGNRRKFISSSGKPVNLGSDGSAPTGTAPLVYLHLDEGEAAANFATNRGTGGDFSITGTLATASTSPSD
jgi:hypothetical protein